MGKFTREGYDMKLSCGCGKTFRLKGDDIERYNVYWLVDIETGKVVPKISCPACTKKWEGGKLDDSY